MITPEIERESERTDPSKSEGRNDRKPAVLVIDSLRLRRCFAVKMIRHWFSGTELMVRWMSTQIPSSDNASCFDYKLVLLNIGSRQPSDPSVHQLMDNILTNFESSALVLISDSDHPNDVRCAFAAGAKGYLPNDLDPEIARHALTFILAGGTYFPPSALLGRNSQINGDTTEENIAPIEDATNKFPKAKQPDVELTSRQQDVVMLLQQGLPNKVIARHLDMTEATVKVHVRQVMRKLGVNNRTQVVLQMAEIRRNRQNRTKPILNDDAAVAGRARSAFAAHH